MTPEAIQHGYDLNTEYLFYLYDDQGPAWDFGGPEGALGGFLKPAFSADFNNDGLLDCQDLDALGAALHAGDNSAGFDLNADGAVNTDDVSAWLADAGTASGYGGPIRAGDTNLDGHVDAADLNTLGLNWRNTDVNGWCQGDFNYDRSVSASDLNDLALNWQSNIAAAASSAVVPEPATLLYLLSCLLAIVPSSRRLV